MSDAAADLKIGLNAAEWMPRDEYQNSTGLELAVATSHRYLEAILADGRPGVDFDRREHSLWQMKGPTVAAIQRILYEALENVRGATPMTAAEILKLAAEEASPPLEQVKRTRTNASRLQNVAILLQGVQDLCADAISDELKARASRIAERAARWPESEPRGQEARQWGECIAWGLDVIENVSGKSPSVDLEELTPATLGSQLGSVEETHPEIDLGEAVSALRDNDVSAAWLALFSFVEGRRRGDPPES